MRACHSDNSWKRRVSIGKAPTMSCTTTMASINWRRSRACRFLRLRRL